MSPNAHIAQIKSLVSKGETPSKINQLLTVLSNQVTAQENEHAQFKRRAMQEIALTKEHDTEAIFKLKQLQAEHSALVLKYEKLEAKHLALKRP
jgi:hypothetical protein